MEHFIINIYKHYITHLRKKYEKLNNIRNAAVCCSVIILHQYCAIPKNSVVSLFSSLNAHIQTF